MGTGKVYIVGAGPGDIGLLTLKGFRYLQMAEVVVYDFHLNAQMLNYISHDAEFIYAGKRGGHHAMTQDEINAALVTKAKEGKIVCRLKGGDPFVFGRGGEEAEVLAAEGIPFEIVPGISSAIAAPAYAGIPLTHRRLSSSFAVVTGNEDVTKPESAIDWSKLAKGFDTLVFLMGVKNIGNITARLMENGKSPDTPVAIVRWGTRPDQKTVVSTLMNIAGLVREERIRPPAVMVVGPVVTLRETLKWYENKPLFGHRILITRDYTKDYQALEDLGGEIFEFPTVEITPPDDFSDLDRCIDRLDGYEWLIFTSANGFRHFLERIISRGKDVRDLRGPKICAIGSKTAEAIGRYGIRVDLVPQEFNAEGLVETFCNLSGQDGIRGKRFLLPRAEKAREVFPAKIRELGGEIDTPTAYCARKRERHGKRLKRYIDERRITVATFTSAATFRNFVDIMGEESIGFLKTAAIAVLGPVTARAIEKAGLTVSIMPKEATIKAMVDEIARWATERRRA
ncbi:MAG TPA: uroporphyrinogen-III C-methyltransferase [Dissulfurispiraceae bacterium]|nr:uroporphyrinogen-III C-methyltransferase [Dissulfurispiraceae bacterium]